MTSKRNDFLVLMVCVVVLLSLCGHGYCAGSIPVADAGSSRYAGTDSVVLDGTGSYDPDGSAISYQWQQVSGSAVTITSADTATPTISGFTQTSSIQTCLFQLIVNDGDMDSTPDTVIVKIVPDTGDGSLIIGGGVFDPDKPTMVYFGGGNGASGNGSIWGGEWSEKANFIIPTGSGMYGGYGTPYERWGDKLIVYLSSVAPDYKQPIQFIGFSTGGRPVTVAGAHLNNTYGDKRYDVNRATLLDTVASASQVSDFLSSGLTNEQCWVDNYISTHSSDFSGVLKTTFLDTSHGAPYSWVYGSINESSWPGGDMYNGGINAGFYYSVIGPGKNLQLASDPSAYHFKWVDSDPDYLTFFDESSNPGRLPEAVTLVGPEDGAIIDDSGVVLSCQPSQNAVGYQLLMGPDPYDMKYVISDTPNPPTNTIIGFPQKTTYWTIKAYDQYGSTIYADPICVNNAHMWPNVNAGDDKAYDDVDKDYVEEVTLDGSASVETDGSIVSWVWTDDGGNTIADGQIATVTLTMGVHTITLTLTDDIGAVNSDTVVITVRVDPARIWYIDDDAFGDPAPGDTSGSDPSENGSAQHPFDAIQEAIDVAVNGNTIIVLDGTYTGIGNRDIDFPGKSITVRSQNGPGNCIVDCQGTESEQHRGFYFHSGEGAGSVLDGFTITNGYVTGRGGAIYAERSSPAILNCAFINNSASDGGGIDIRFSSSTVSGCIFTGNSATNYGGGILNSTNNITVTNCTFSQNSANIGGAMFNSTSGTILSNCIFWSNSASRENEIFNAGSTPVISYCDIQGSGGSGAGWDGSLGTDAGGNIDIDPLFVDMVGGDVHLLPDSPCIDAGDNTAVGAGISKDLDGNPRFTDAPKTDTGNGTAPIVDMGAYEVQQVIIVGYELLWQERFSRTGFEYCFRARAENSGTSDLENITFELKSAPANITVLNSKVFFDSVPASGEVLSDDTFIVRIDRSSATDENDIVWKISNEMEGDFSGDGVVNLADFAYLAGKWLQTGTDMPEDLYKNEMIDFDDLTMFLENWLNN